METNNRHIIFSNSECVDKETLIEYKRGKLSGEHNHRVEQHLIDCMLCSEALDGYLNTKNIKLDVYALKLKVLNISEKPQVLKVIYKNKHRLSIAAGILVFIGIFSLFTQLIKNISTTENQNIAQRKIEELRNPNKIDYNYEIKDVSPNIENGEKDNEDVDLKETLPVNPLLRDKENAKVEEEIVIAEEEYLEGGVNNEGAISKELSTGGSLQEKSDGSSQLDGETLSFNNSAPNDIEKTTIIIESSEKEESDEYIDAQTEKNKKIVNSEIPKMRVSVSDQASGATNGSNQISRGDVIIGMNKIQLTKQMRTYYDNSDFLILIYTFEEYVNTIADETELIFYVARSYDVNIKNTKAIKYYNKVIESQDPYYKIEAKWYLAKKYINMNFNKEKATTLLEELVRSNSRYKSQSKAELKKIKEKENKNNKKNKIKRGNMNQLSSPIFH